MNAHRGGHAAQILISGSTQPGKKGLLRILLLRNLGKIAQLKPLPAPRQRGMRLRGKRAQALDSLPPVLDDDGPRSRQLLIPHIQGIDQRGLPGNFPQKRVSLIERAHRPLKRIEIRRPQLRKLHVQKTTALRRPAFDDLKILRGKQNRAHVPQQFADALRLARADAHRFALLLGFVKRDAHLVRTVPLLGPHAHTCARLPPTDELVIARGPVASSQAAQVKRFQNVCLPLCIGPGEHRHARAWLDERALVVPKVRQTQGFYAHGLSPCPAGCAEMGISARIMRRIRAPAAPGTDSFRPPSGR